MDGVFDVCQKKLNIKNYLEILLYSEAKTLWGGISKFHKIWYRQILCNIFYKGKSNIQFVK